MGFNSQYSTLVKRKRSREWFCTIWKVQIGYTDVKLREDDWKEEEIEKYIHERNFEYDNLKFKLEQFAESHLGTKWAFAYHNRGINLGDEIRNGKLVEVVTSKNHELSEHIHFVLKTENPISGSSIMKHFKFAHVDFAKSGIANCANYLLHNTASSFVKHRVPKEDLFCSGRGEHGEIWFPLVSANSYEPFIPDNIIHYVYNENMSSMFEFMARFGHIVCSSAYAKPINEAIEYYKRREVSKVHIKEIFDMLTPQMQLEVLSKAGRVGIVEATTICFDDISDYKASMVWFDLECIYIWYRNSTVPANDDMTILLSYYGLVDLLEVNKDRTDLRATLVNDYEQHEDSQKDIIANGDY